MTPSFALYRIVEKSVHVPSTDYYARGNASEIDQMYVLERIDKYSTHEAAVEGLKLLSVSSTKQQYTILPVYSM